MQEPLTTPVATLILAATLLSVLALSFLWRKSSSGSPLLPYEQRRRVPWHFLAALLALILPSVFTQVLTGTDADSVRDMKPSEFIHLGWVSSIAKLSVVFLGGVCLAKFLKADRKDLGLPKNIHQALQDCRLGLVACLASLLPIYAIQLAISRLFDSQEQHPLIDQMQESYSLQMVILSLVVAVIVAPIYEEFVFRLLLQGWLEKFEDRHTGYFATERYAAPSDEPPAATHPTHGMIPELPHGWTPILVSGLIFGLVHIGQSVAAPVSLTLFGIVLGYLYQRTHRLLPCIVAHMALNAFTLAMVLLQSGQPSV